MKNICTYYKVRSTYKYQRVAPAFLPRHTCGCATNRMTSCLQINVLTTSIITGGQSLKSHLDKAALELLDLTLDVALMRFCSRLRLLFKTKLGGVWPCLYINKSREIYQTGPKYPTS